MNTITINGIEAVTLGEIAKATGVSVDALRRRVSRGTLNLEPAITIGGIHFYSAALVRSHFRESLEIAQ